MANTITVTVDQVTKKAEELKNLNSKLKKKIENLITQENSLNGMWDGQANDEFHNAFQKDITQMNNFYTTIEQYIAKLNEIANEYRKAEQKNVSIASKRTYK